jgi:7,8-dihydropterin-6-yl-methyl-4-(beta-D-ribofuranosyl)aminobenzene 5'-phosphate synthase
VEQNIGQVESVKITTLLDDYAGYETSFYAQHGISLLVEACSGGVCKRILLDVGQSGKPILHNMELLGIDPVSIDAVFLSHCHYDHTQGLVEILKAVGKGIPVIGHPSIFRENYVLKPFIRNIGITEENGVQAIKAAGGQLFLTGETFEIMPGVFSTGEVERTVDFEKQGIGTYNLEDGHISGDRIIDDLSIVVNVNGKGLVVVVGCSHAGIVNIIRHARKITGVEKVAAVIGGFHLIEASKERIQKTAAALKEMDIELLAPGHCTGLKASAEIARELGNRFAQLHVGKIVDIS